MVHVAHIRPVTCGSASARPVCGRDSSGENQTFAPKTMLAPASTWWPLSLASRPFRQSCIFSKLCTWMQPIDRYRNFAWPISPTPTTLTTSPMAAAVQLLLLVILNARPLQIAMNCCARATWQLAWTAPVPCTLNTLEPCAQMTLAAETLETPGYARKMQRAWFSQCNPRPRLRPGCSRQLLSLKHADARPRFPWNLQSANISGAGPWEKRLALHRIC